MTYHLDKTADTSPYLPDGANQWGEVFGVVTCPDGHVGALLKYKGGPWFVATKTEMRRILIKEVMKIKGVKGPRIPAVKVRGEGDEKQSYGLTLDRATVEDALALGNGSVSEGVREAFRRLRNLTM